MGLFSQQHELPMNPSYTIFNCSLIRPQAFLIALAFVLTARVLSAQCSDQTKLNPDACSVRECKTRQALVHKTCDVPRTCKYGGRQADLKVFKDRNLACLQVRKAVGECYKTPDKGHNDQIEKAQASLEECEARIRP